jgi:hypothetical protein
LGIDIPAIYQADYGKSKDATYCRMANPSVSTIDCSCRMTPESEGYPNAAAALKAANKPFGMAGM